MSNSKEQFYRSVFENIRASIAITRQRAVVQTEDKDDEEFWRKVFAEACPMDNFMFVSATRTPYETMATGCANCLRYAPCMTDHRFVVAIDSDLRHLLGDVAVNSHSYIIQTYTYSIENHLCYSSRLNQLIADNTKSDSGYFNFEIFLKALSEAIYPLWLMYLYDYEQASRKYSKDDWCRVISLPAIELNLENNGEEIIKKIQTKAAADFSMLANRYPSFVLNDEAQRYHPLGMVEENAYLYVRGHDVYDLIEAIGLKLQRYLLDQKKKELLASGKETEIKALYASVKLFKALLAQQPLFFNYPEIQKSISKIQTIFQ